MARISMGNGIDLPKDIVEAFNNDPNNMLCAVFRSLKDQKLSTRELRTTQFDLKLLQDIIDRNGWQKEGGEFAIIDNNGIIYQTEGSNFVATIDENGYIHINDDEYFVHSHTGGYTGGITKERVDYAYKRGIENMFWDRDENFGEDGFVAKAKIEQEKTDPVTKVSDRSHHEMTVEEGIESVRKSAGLDDEISKIAGTMHDMSHTPIQKEDASIKPRELAELDKEEKIKESELMPIKKRGFKEFIKSFIDKITGKGEK